MSDAAISLSVLVAAIVALVWNRLPVELVAIGVALTLYATGVIDLHTTFAGFGDPVVLFLAALFIVGEGVDATGVTAWTSRSIEKVVGNSRTRLLVTTMMLGAGMASLISPNGAVAALLPMTLMTARRCGHSPSLVAMPLAFAAGSGALLVLTGSPINLMASEAAVSSGAAEFSFWSFAWVGLPLVIGTVVIAAMLGPRLLPVRNPDANATGRGGARTVHEQHRDGARRTADRAVDCGGDVAVAEAVPDAGCCCERGLTADTDLYGSEHDGDGARRLSLG